MYPDFFEKVRLVVELLLAIAFLGYAVGVTLIALTPRFLRRQLDMDEPGIVILALVLLGAFALCIAGSKTPELGLLPLGGAFALMAITAECAFWIRGPLGGGIHVGPGWVSWCGWWDGCPKEKVVADNVRVLPGLFRHFTPRVKAIDKRLEVGDRNISLVIIVSPLSCDASAIEFLGALKVFEQTLDDLLTAHYLLGRVGETTKMSLWRSLPLKVEIARIGEKLGVKATARLVPTPSLSLDLLRKGSHLVYGTHG